MARILKSLRPSLRASAAAEYALLDRIVAQYPPEVGKKIGDEIASTMTLNGGNLRNAIECLRNKYAADPTDPLTANHTTQELTHG